MRTDVECVSPEESTEDAAQLMLRQGEAFLPVCDRLGKVLGTVSGCDIALRLVAEGLPSSTLVGDIMTHEVITCSAQDDLGRAEDLMSEHSKSRILCIDEAGRLEGIVSLSDIKLANHGQAADSLQQAG